VCVCMCVSARIQSSRMSGDPFPAPLFLRIEVENHCVKWHQEFKFPCKMYAPANTAELEPCICKISVRKVSQLPNKEEENTECTATIFFLNIVHATVSWYLIKNK